MRGLLADPSDPSTFERSKLDFSEREKNGFIYLMHKDLLRIKREDDVLRAAGAGNFDGAVLGAEAFLVRFFSGGDDDRLLLVNLGRDLRLTPAPEPLLAPHENKSWEMLWSSEDPAYRGNGTPEVETGECWRIPGQAAILLKPKTNGESKSWMP
jgi:maltooligosyltrehalose trehalohydrolase